ncbi:MAG: flippase, partial [Candidatus Omnitrophica bacterium]|nr:flippase [Candidatus Omnitrophota bacterium]
MKTIQRIVKNTTILTSAEIINKALSLFLYIAIANYLKAAGYGRFSFIMAFLALFHVLANFGLNKLIIREVAKNKEITRGYVSFMMKLKTFFSLSAYLIFILCVCLMKKSPEVIYGAYLIGLSMIFISLSNVYLSVFNAHEKLEINAFSLILIKIIIVGLVILFISLKGSLLLILSAFVAGEAFRLLVLWLVYDKSFKCKLSEEAVKLPVKRILKTAFPFVLAGAASLIYMHVDKIMISVIKGDEAVGWYSAAYTLIVGLMFIPRCYTLSVFPAISRYAESSKRLLNISWQRSVKYLLIISLPIAVGVFILAERFINILYHSGYENATVALRILILAVPWIFVNSINIYLLYAANFQ